MKYTLGFAVMALMSWCDSLGDGCAPIFSPPGGASAGSTSGTETSPDASTSVPPVTTSGEPTTAGSLDPGATTQGVAASSTGVVTTGPEDPSAATDTGGTGATSETSVTSDTSTGGPEPACGDGKLDPGETCDPGIEPPPAGQADCVDCQVVRAVDLAAGSAHACVLLSDGRVRCWGENDAGQVGAAMDFEDVRVGNDPDPLDIGDGEIDLSRDVTDVQETNGRIFAGGTTSCATSPGAGADAFTWCWGEGFGVAGKGLKTASHYSALAIGDRYDDDADPPTWLVCGFTKGVDTYDMRCWGHHPTLLFTPKGQVCSGTVGETNAALRTMKAAVPWRGDASASAVCMVGGASTMECAGFTKFIDPCGNIKNRCSAGVGACPSPCDTTGCQVDAGQVAASEFRMCVLAGDKVQCFNGAAAFTYGEMCGGKSLVDPTELAMTGAFVCAGDNAKVCCHPFLPGPTPGVVLQGPLRKLAAQRDLVWALDDGGVVTRISIDMPNSEFIAVQTPVSKQP